MKKIIFWIIVVLGTFFVIGTIINVLSHTIKIADRITLGAIPYVLVGIVLDLITNPAGWLGVVLLVVAFIIKKKT